jgi:hypothetical protein
MYLFRGSPGKLQKLSTGVADEATPVEASY